MRLIIGGDVCPTEFTVPAFERGDVPALFGTVPTLFEGADRVIINLECALTERESRIRKCGPNLKGRPSYAAVLKQAGITDAGLSNNHTFDFGEAALRDTAAALESAGIGYTGIGDNEQDARKPYYMEIGNKIVALVAVCEHEYSYALADRAGTWGFDPFETMEDITAAAEKADYVIVLYHGGKEQSPFPSPRLRKACRAMVRAGADAVFCQHSHCSGCYELYRGGHIVYGEGNFNFVEHSGNPQWANGLVAALDFPDDGAPASVPKADLTLYPVVVTDTGITLAEGEEKDALLDAFNDRSRILQDEKQWLEQWDAFCRKVEPGYRMSIDNALENGFGERPKEHFPHYLDCEAHTDVWRWLFRTWHGFGEDETV